MHLLPRATLVALCSLSLAAPSALAAENGGAAVGAGAQATTQAPVPTTPAPATGDATGTSASAPATIQTQTVTLTRTQTKSVQKRVRVKPDGALGSRTRTAIKKFQTRKALTRTGKPNVETLRSLGLKLADKLEAKLLAQQAAGGATNQTIAAPAGAAGAAIAAARTAIGTPYRSAGTTLAGFDCSGLTQWAFGKAGVKLPRTSFDQYEQGTQIEQDAIQAGDLVFFDSAGSGASHVGIATSPTTVISATTRGVMEHTFASGYWAGHYVGARRLGEAAVPAATAASVR